MNLQIIGMKFENIENVICVKVVVIKERIIRVFVQSDYELLLVIYYS